VAGPLEHLEPGDPVAHRLAVFHRAGAVVAPLDDQRGHSDPGGYARCGAQYVTDSKAAKALDLTIPQSVLLRRTR
jgi:hypothetical protein